MSQTIAQRRELTFRVSAIVLPIILVAGLLIFPSVKAQGDQNLIVDTKHNLSASGPGAVKAVGESRICIFCHTPHGGAPVAPLWNRYESVTVFDIYPSGGSMQSTPTQPNGSTRICLSCHDGTSALGTVRNLDYSIPFTGTSVQGGLPAGESNLGISLSDDHPVSFVPSLEDPEIRLPDIMSPVHLDGNGEMQCRTCHDPHDNSIGNFLVLDNIGSQICIICHQKPDWDISVHGHPQDPQYIQLIDQGCSSCHIPHTAPTAPRLLRQAEENMCYTCHDGLQNAAWETAGASDIQQQFQKSSIHPVMLNSNVHDPGEGPRNSFPAPSVFLPEDNAITLRHVECVDCHNPHAASEIDIPQNIASSLNHVWGVDENGQKVSPSTREYQICLKCHGDSENLPFDQTNKRLEFLSSNASYHPVVSTGTASVVPGLISPWTEQSTMDCSDCHGDSDPLGPQGLHGSDYSHILRLSFFDGVGQIETPFLYELCYSCHDRSSLFNNTISRFDEHEEHVISEQLSCKMCHNSHGSAQYTHLISFDEQDPNISVSSSGRLEYIDFGNGTGQCYLTCHGKNHNPESY
ncbi:doubled CXXCH motif [bacterium BMS3Bbin04]|nr:doubled CXXCH motif [bacterium BMS3Bbin04]